jgi:hypothetical protein
MQENPFVKFMKPFENLVPILKTSFLAVLIIALNFRKFLKVVWTDLNQICKIYKGNKKTEKEKKKRK